MAINFALKEKMKERNVTSRDLSRRIGITEANFSHLVTGKTKAIRVDLLDRICKELDCQPGEILRYR